MPEIERRIAEIPEVSGELLATYEPFDPEKKYFLFCGDDRPLTMESAWNLGKGSGDYADLNNAVRTFGAAVGSARAVAVALFAEADPQKSINARGNFVGWTREVSSQLKDHSNLVPGAHSAEANEGNPEIFSSDSEQGLGCAYAANAEAVTGINTSKDIVAFADDVIQLLGSSPIHLAKITEANERAKEYFNVGGEKSFNMNRGDMSNLNLPIAIVEGSHAPVSDVRIVINLTDEYVSNPRKALELETPAYNADPVIECRAILQAYPELDARLLLEAKIVDICATAEALASGEGKHAWDFTFERIGNFEDAVAALEAIKKQSA